MPAKTEYSTVLWHVTLPMARKFYELQTKSNLFCNTSLPWSVERSRTVPNISQWWDGNISSNSQSVPSFGLSNS